MVNCQIYFDVRHSYVYYCKKHEYHKPKMNFILVGNVPIITQICTHSNVSEMEAQCGEVVHLNMKIQNSIFTVEYF